MKQEQFFRDAQRNSSAVMEQFSDVMKSDNPLNNAEIQALYKKRPNKYGFLKSWLKDVNTIK